MQPNQNPLMALLARLQSQQPARSRAQPASGSASGSSEPLRFQDPLFNTVRKGTEVETRETEAGTEILAAAGGYDAKEVNQKFAETLGFKKVDGAYLDSQGRNASFDVLDDGTILATTHLGDNRYERFRAGVDGDKTVKRSEAKQFEDKSQTWSSISKDTLRQGLPLILAMSGVGAPLSAALGGGAVGAMGAGAIIGGGSAALTGGDSKDILRGAVTGGATSGASRFLTPAISNAVGGGQVGNAVANATTSAGLAALRGQDPLQAALTGGMRGAGISPQAINILSRIIQSQRGRTPQTPRRG
jgi:hypothetical protein